MDRAVGGGRILDAFFGLQVTPDEEVLDAGKQSAPGKARVPGAGVVVGQVLPNVPPYWIVGVSVP